MAEQFFRYVPQHRVEAYCDIGWMVLAHTGQLGGVEWSADGVAGQWRAARSGGKRAVASRALAFGVDEVALRDDPDLLARRELAFGLGTRAVPERIGRQLPHARDYLNWTSMRSDRPHNSHRYVRRSWSFSGAGAMQASDMGAPQLEQGGRYCCNVLIWLSSRGSHAPSADQLARKEGLQSWASSRCRVHKMCSIFTA